MATNQEGSGSKRRVSFLMPYIDFCFMLIIIFVGMLSIAYFEPNGRTDVQTKQANELDNLEGKWQKKPVGLQVQQLGVGEKSPDQNVVPLVSSASQQTGSDVRPMVRTPSQRFEKQPGTSSNDRKPSGNSKDQPAGQSQKNPNAQTSGQTQKIGAARFTGDTPAAGNATKPSVQVKPAVENNAGGIIPSATTTVSNGDHFYIDLRHKTDNH
jgi:hypothetical protein